jgi:hypothetical protein
MAVNDTEVTTWSVTSANNQPADASKVQDDLAANIRNVKGVYVTQVSRDKGFLHVNPPSTLTPVPTVPGLYTLSCQGNWLGYLQRNRKIKFYNAATREALYAHVVAGGNFSGITAAYSAAAGVTSATIRVFGTFSAYYNRVAFGTDNAAPAIFPFDGVSGMFKYSSVNDNDTTVDVDITFPAPSGTVYDTDAPKVLLPRNIFTTAQCAASDTNRSFCVDAFVRVTASRTNSSNSNCTRVVKVYKLTHSGFTVTLGGNPAFGQTAGSTSPGTFYVLLEWSVISAAQHVPLSAQTGRFGYYYPGVP